MTDGAAGLGGQPLAAFLAALAAKQPAPGGGAAAGALAGVAAALGEMVVNYSSGRKSLIEHAQLYQDATDRLQAARERAITLADDDAEAYAQLNALQKLDEADPERAAGWADAVRGAIEAPKSTFELALEILNVCDALTGKSNEWLRSDLAIAAIAAEAAAAAAAWNVRINLSLIESDSDRGHLEAALEDGLARARDLRADVEQRCR